jgi:hypothetical protein
MENDSTLRTLGTKRGSGTCSKAKSECSRVLVSTSSLTSTSSYFRASKSEALLVSLDYIPWTSRSRHGRAGSETVIFIHVPSYLNTLEFSSILARDSDGLSQSRVTQTTEARWAGSRWQEQDGRTKMAEPRWQNQDEQQCRIKGSMCGHWLISKVADGSRLCGGRGVTFYL